MSALLPILVSNALAASALAAVILLLRRHLRRPPVIHALWLLVLLKLVTPPLFDVPIARFEVSIIASEERPPVPPLLPAGPPGEHDVGGEMPAFGGAPLLAAPIAGPARPAPSWQPDWTVLALLTWMLGVAAVLALAAARALRFRRLLGLAAATSPALQERCDELAARLGLRRSPEVVLLPGRLSPMLWSWGGRRASLVLPSGLLAGIGVGERDALLAHELAHLKRGDHRVRLLELGVVAIYWWLPTQWLVRRALREAEEDCCDAWVVWALRGAERTYADALLALVSFLSGSRVVLPPAASGAGQIRSLRRRLAMIMEATTPRALSGWARGSLLLLAALLLPVFPSFAQEEPKRRYSLDVRPIVSNDRRFVTLELVATDDPLMEVQEAPQEAPDPERVARIRKHVQEAKRNLERLHERIRILRASGALKDAEQAELAELKDRLAQLETMLVELSKVAAEASPPRRLPGVDPRRNDPGKPGIYFRGERIQSLEALRAALEARDRAAARADSGAPAAEITRARDSARKMLEELLRKDPGSENVRQVLEWLEEHRAKDDAPRRATRSTFDRLVDDFARVQQKETPLAEASRLYREALNALNAAKGQVKPDNPLAEIVRARDAAKAAQEAEAAQTRYTALTSAALKALLEAHRLQPNGLPVEEVEEIEEVEEVEPASDPFDARRREEVKKRQADELQRVNEMEVRYQDLRTRNEQLRARQQDLESKLAALQAELDRLRAKKDL